MIFNWGTVIILRLHRVIFLKQDIEPLITCIEQLIEGLDKFGLAKCIREDPIAFRFKFCHSNIQIWIFDLLIYILNVKYKSEDLNEKMLWIRVYLAFIEKFEISFYDGILLLIFYKVSHYGNCFCFVFFFWRILDIF